MAHEEAPARDKGSLLRLFARIGAVLTLLAALIPASIALYGLLTRPDPAVADYQKQAVATCNRVRDTLGRNHNAEVLNLQSAGPQGPTINKAGLVQVLANNLAEVRGEFSLLNSLKTPGLLADKKHQVDQAQQAFYESIQSNIQFVQANVRDGESLQELSRQYTPREAADAQAMARLSAAMSALAGAECKLTGTAAGGPSSP